MKTKTKLVPKSGAAINSTDSGRCNVVVSDGYEGVCGVGPSVPSKKQCVHASTSVPCRVEGSHVATNVVGPSVMRQLDKSDGDNSKTNGTREEKGKMIMTEPEITAIVDLRSTHCNKTIKAVVYRKWTSRHVYTRQPIKYCILIDKQGTPIQANMDVKDVEYFNQLLPLRKAYKILGFSCEQTGLWEQTLDNPTSLIFGKFINLEEIPSHDFPEHYFNFSSYNELPARADIRNAILTYYVGRIQAVSRIYTLGDPTTNRTRRRIVDIQNLRLSVKFLISGVWRISLHYAAYGVNQYCCKILIARGGQSSN
uniref:Uncharacterized protein n=1 Tax=Tanacetum cinerariifolium TaxID=118510 RepID=A0A6L2P0R6_TANCI|nr:hypothetical protein [Tanacetum cinerariifolium]